MIKILSFFVSVIIIFSSGLMARDYIHIVESVPQETSLGISETARTSDAWLKMINGATKNIDIAAFYISHKKGQAFSPILSAIKTAAKRGVKIRILADAKMAKIYPESLDQLNAAANIAVRRIAYYNELGGVMHAKYFVVDRQKLFLGSQNMDWRAISQIHEVGLEIENAELAEYLSDIFQRDWQLAAGTTASENMQETVKSEFKFPVQIPFREEEKVRIYPTLSPKKLNTAQDKWDENELVELIDGSKSELNIQLLSYKPLSRRHFYAPLDNALRRAAARGVKVKLIVSNWNLRQPGVFALQSLQIMPNISVKISTIPQHSSGHIPYGRVEHCKIMTVDGDKVWLGTSNWSYSYFHTSRNIALVAEGDQFSGIINKIFYKSWNSEYCELIDPVREYEAPDVAGKEGK